MAWVGGCVHVAVHVYVCGGRVAVRMWVYVYMCGVVCVCGCTCIRGGLCGIGGWVCTCGCTRLCVWCVCSWVYVCIVRGVCAHMYVCLLCASEKTWSMTATHEHHLSAYSYYVVE